MERTVSVPAKCLIGGSYVGLIAVNVLASSKWFGLPTNSDISAAYPTSFTPAGFTFSIWGPIFLLEGAGTVAICCGAVPPSSFTAIGVPWVATWACECLWQFVFFTAPIPADSATSGRRLLTLVPSAVLLVSAYASMLTGGIRLRMRASTSNASVGSQIASALLIDLPTGLNAGWLAAASGIGLTLVFQLTVPALATPQGGAVVVTGVSCLAVIVATAIGSSFRSLVAGLAYLAATAWACFGITRADGVTNVIAAAASRGIWIAGAGGVVATLGAVANRCCCESDETKALRTPLRP
mmetsp:Transcript_62536/g.116265  ORF Transcript_62536/g.116265 Transcript_62536/m.116265 type:complete len:296 (+) Transcript_62536:71-958(+)